MFFQSFGFFAGISAMEAQHVASVSFIAAGTELAFAAVDISVVMTLKIHHLTMTFDAFM